MNFLPTLSWPALPAIHSIPTSVWAACGVVAIPFIVIFGALAIKLLWGLWPIPAAIAASAVGVWKLGIEWFWLVALGIAAGIVVTWLWQRTPLFLRGDRMLERRMFLGD